MSMNFHHLKIHQPQMIKIYAKSKIHDSKAQRLQLCRKFSIDSFPMN